MKKTLLLSMLGLTTMSAFALQDVTPAKYIFNNVNEFTYHNQVYGTSNIGVPVWETIDGDKNFDKGLVVLCGAVAGWGKGQTEPLELMNTVDGPILLGGTSIVDLGGEVGKVLCINGKASKINERIQDLYGVDMQIPNMTGGLHWFNMNFFADPTTLSKDGSDDYFNVRCRITCNFYYNFPNGPEDGVSLVNPFLVGNQGNIATTDNKICTDWFIKVNEDEEPVDDTGEVSEEAYYWDPEKWVQFEVNMQVKPDEEDKSYNPVRLKYDIKVDPLQNGTMFIRSIEFFVPTQEEAVNNSLPVVNYITLKADPKPAGIAAVGSDDNGLKVNVNGGVATFTEDAEVYSVTGALVARVAANDGVTLPAGAYIAAAAGKNVKFCVK